MTGFCLFWLQRLLYGPLRPIETEQLYERAWFAVTETCLAMTIFRGELGGWFLVMFISLLVGKVWGWIGEGRVEYLEQQPPANPRLFHIRLAISLVLAVLFNAFMLQYCVNTVIHQARPDMMVMFGFEFAILTILSTSTASRYGIALMEIYVTRQQVRAKMEERRAEIRAARENAIRESARAGETSPPADIPNENDVNELEIDVPGWEEKGRWVFYLDLVTDFVKLLVYVIFFAILITFYGLPIHILRDVFVTIRSFVRRILDFLRYRNATRDMNERYPNATAEEVAREEVCIICREEMHAVPQAPDAAGEGGQQPAAGVRRVPDRLRPKKLPCGHILHFACLRSWLERQQNCPTCRRPVIGGQTGAGAGANANAAGGANGQQNLAGGNQMPGQPRGQGDGAPRARVYQFGPFRIGFGAVRGDLIPNLHQQIHQGQAPLQPAANPNPRGARQIGFGFGFGRRPPAPPLQNQNPMPAPYNFEDVHAQLHQIEQRITQEINTLRIATDQLRRVRELQLELEQLRLQEASPFFQPTTPTASAPHAQGTSLFSTSPHLETSSDSAPMVAGDPRLPEGLQLPAGWTMVPVQGAGTAPQGSNTEPATTIPPVNSDSTEPTSSQTRQGQTVPEITITNGDQDNATRTVGSDNVGSSERETIPVDWSTPTTSTADPRTDSPSQDWTEVPSEAGPSSIPTSWGSNGQAKESAEPKNLQSDDSSKGKSRAATVEEAADQDAS